MRSELVISTYNNPDALRLCLASVARQSVTLPVCFADDGSGPETAEVIAQFAATRPEGQVRHVWHEDRGFEKCAILNKAIAASQADHIVFIDGDVLIHPGFVARHLELARPGRFCTGSLIRLSASATAGVTRDMISSGVVFDRGWLRGVGAIDRTGTWLKTMPLPKPVMNALEVISPVQRALCGANASAFRADMIGVNGYDESMKYGSEDKEFGVRLGNAGVKGRHLRFTAPLVHLDHPRGYADPERIARQKAMVRSARASGKTWTEDGIVKGPRHV